MKKFLASAAVAAALVAGAQSAMATPTLTLTITDATATAAQCSALSLTGENGPAVFSAGGTCTVSTNVGDLIALGTYGSAHVDNETGSGAPFLAEPQLWLNYLNQFSTAGTQIVTLTATGYSQPLSPYMSTLLPTATTNSGMTGSVQFFFDANNNSDPAGVGGDLVKQFNLTSINAVGLPTSVGPLPYNGGTYSEEWVLNATASGPTSTIGGALEVVNMPAPTPLSLLGFGLVALGFLARRRGFQS